MFCSSHNTGVQAALKAVDSKIGRLVVFGTPAEEGQGGKIMMIENGCFNEVDFIMMVHPSTYNAAFPTYIAHAGVTVIFKGHEAHASGGPWEGINALDAAVMAYSGISTMSQQMKPTWRVHGIIAEGGTAVNVIPARTRLEFGGHAPTIAELQILKKKMTSVFEAAALATGQSQNKVSSGTSSLTAGTSRTDTKIKDCGTLLKSFGMKKPFI